MLMLKSYRFRLFPTKSQVRILERQLELCRQVYNDTLAYRKNAWENDQRQVKRFETQDRLPQLKVDHPEFKEVHSLTLQNVVLRVELAFKAFFRRVKAGENPGYPRFKGKGRYDSITYPQSGFGLDSDKLHLSKIGDIKIKLHRPIEGKIKTCIVRRMPTGKWFACFSVDMGDVQLPPWKDGSVVGIDVGLESFATLSNGETIANPRFFRDEEKELARVQKKLSNASKGTPERKKAIQVVERVHERIANRRNDFANKVSRQLVDRFGVIVFEDLDIRTC